MTPRSLMQHIMDLPDELMDVDIEFVVSFDLIPKDDGSGESLGVRQDCYIGAIAFSLEEKTVHLMALETMEKIEAYFEKTS